MAPSKQVIGHLDKRKALTRCKPCAKRRIKCQGGFPCEYCTRTGKACERQAPVKADGAFQFVTYASTRGQPNLVISPCVDSDRATIYLGHFVTVVGSCHFTSSFPSVATCLIPVMDGNEHLRDIAIAIGALDANRRADIGHNLHHPSPRVVAFTNYQRALTRLQDKLSLKDAPQRDDVLWTTFLLGLFELMSEPTGDRWARHMLYGTGRMLQLADMHRCPSPLKSMLFEAFQVLEANRAVMYGVDTFLSEDNWIVVRKRQALDTGQSADSAPMDEVVTLMIYTASFNQRFFEHINQIPEVERHTHPVVASLGVEGIYVQNLLHKWHSQHSSALYTQHKTPQNTLSLIYYHTLLLFLSRNYTYYPYWTDKATPLLDSATIAYHTEQTMCLMEELQLSNVPGVMLLFPLRVVGSLLDDAATRSRLMKQLDAIYWKGFIVADRIKIDLEDLWAFMGLEDVGGC